MIGSYAIERAKEATSIGIVFPADYITLMSRIAFIPVTAPHPESAKLFLDYLLSERGQKFLLARSVLCASVSVQKASYRRIATTQSSRSILVRNCSPISINRNERAF